MMYLVRLIHKSTEDVLRYLEANGLNPYVGEKGAVFEKDIDGQTYRVSIFLSNNLVTAVIIDCPELKDFNLEKYENQIKKTKKYLEPIYGLPYMDNTNHTSEVLWITYEKDDIVVTISGDNGMNDEGKYSFYVFVGEKQEIKPKASLWYLILFMAPGLIYVVSVMFLTMSFGNFNIDLFLKYMLGGTLVGILIGTVGSIILRLAAQRRKISIKQECDEKFFKYQQKNGYESAMPLTVYPNQYRARLFTKGQKVVVCYETIFRLKKLDVDLDAIRDKMFLDVFPVIKGKKIYYCKLHEQEDIVALITLLEDTFYQNEEYRALRTMIDNVFKSYNPYSRLNRYENAFAPECFYISKLIYQEPQLTLQDIKNILTNIYDDGYDYIKDEPMIKELAELIVQALQESDTEFAQKR